MARINDSQSGHGSKSERYDDGSIDYFYRFPEKSREDLARLEKVKRAIASIDRLDKRMGLTTPCNRYFAQLPRKRSFHRLWRDETIFINYSPSRVHQLYGATHSNGKDITITRWCIDKNSPWMIGATIIHEFAHVDGALAEGSDAAERAVKECGFGPQYDPTIFGSLRSLAKLLSAAS